MLCDDCGQNEAQVHIVQIGPDGRLEKNLCENCAKEYGGNIYAPQNEGVSLNDFLKGVFGGANAVRSQDPTACPNCGMRYQDFQATGKIGCAVCYTTFRSELEPLLRRIHGSSPHSGKIPRRTGGVMATKQKITILRRNLDKAVAQEEYEKAAQYRDKIRELEQLLAQGEGGAAGGNE
ncbi:MAG: UvrB/UvrC motif-containing protein [Selenomonadaceae bacterium]|nr:UvrB/UvrC motif-containing protein [Selenomonadaceae bacterium]